MDDHRFRPEHHVRRRSEFQQAYAGRVSAGDGWLVVFGRRNGLRHPRLGLAVSRKVGGAVRRNRWKRLIREAFRLTRRQLPDGVDLIVIPRPGAEPALADLARSLPRLAKRVASRLERSR